MIPPEQHINKICLFLYATINISSLTTNLHEGRKHLEVQMLHWRYFGPN